MSGFYAVYIFYVIVLNKSLAVLEGMFLIHLSFKLRYWEMNGSNLKNNHMLWNTVYYMRPVSTQSKLSLATTTQKL